MSGSYQFQTSGGVESPPEAPMFSLADIDDNEFTIMQRIDLSKFLYLTVLAYAS
jgi:hypothetical protein